MTPYEELRTYGQFDEAGYNLLFELTRQELCSFRGLQPAAGVGDYLEAPYRVRRRQGSTPEIRAELASTLSDLQARIALHRAWLQVEAPAAGHAYDDLVSAARAEAGTQMTHAWNATPLTSDADMNLKVAYPHPQADAERIRVVAAMRRHLPGSGNSPGQAG